MLDATTGARPQILYWGPTLPDAMPAEITQLSVRQPVHGRPDVDIQPSLSNELGAGYISAPGLAVHRNGADWATLLHVTDVEHPDRDTACIICEDINTGVRAIYTFTVDKNSHVLTAGTEITNLRDEPLSVDWCAALNMPINERLTNLISFTGRWAGEFRCENIPPFRGAFLRENNSGRTGHDTFPAIIALADDTTEQAGFAAGFHLAWSGNSRIRVDRLADGQSFAQLGELFYPGEIILGKDETYRAPSCHFAWSSQGLNALSQQFHTHLTQSVMDGRIHKKPRPVHYNTWEAVYFDQDEETLFRLAEKAAAIGAERFVLDDGWFGARRSDRAGLGDWTVSTDVFPKGLAPLAKKIRSLGMEFGLWFEPEMANPDSDLLRAHPDWILQAPGVEQIPMRHQVVLDLTRPEVVDHIFEKMHAIIAAHEVDYIKWDMNRDIHHPGSNGRATAYRQTNAVYALMQRLRGVFPTLEIESCSSGGARADYGILRYADRIWTSDSNDALDRQQIQRGASYFFPPSVMGAHVGPRECHITGRILPMSFRAATAIFGHMGVEADILQETAEDLAILANAIALYKEHRGLLHHGAFYRLDAPTEFNCIGVVGSDQREAIFSCAKLATTAATHPGKLRLAGLDPTLRYRVRMVWPHGDISPTEPSIIDTADLKNTGAVFSGDALTTIGMPLPVMYPNSCLIFYLNEA